MENELLKSMFLQARDQYESATRWSSLLVFICLIFHLMTFHQYISVNQQLTLNEAAVTRLSGLEQRVADLNANFVNFQEYILGAPNTSLDVMLNELRIDFENLDRTVAQIDTPATAQFTTASFSPMDPASSVAIQMPQQPVQAEAPFLLDATLVQKISEATDINELRMLLLPVIETQIIGPRFDQLNRDWRNQVLPQVQRQAKPMLEELQQINALFPEGSVLAASSRQSLEQAVDLMTSLEFQPPVDDPKWWTSVAEKEATLADIGRAVEDRLRTVIDSVAIYQLADQLSAVAAQQKQLRATFQAELQQIKENYAQQQAKLADLGQPFEILSFDLDFVVAYFPLLLGLALASASIWPVYRLRELAWSVDLLLQKNQAEFLTTWFQMRTGLPFPILQGAMPDAITARSQHLALRSNRRWWLEIVGRSFIYWVWIMLAAWQLSGFGDVNAARSITLATGGYVAVALALGYQWYITRHALNSHEQLPEPSPTQTQA